MFTIKNEVKSVCLRNYSIKVISPKYMKPHEGNIASSRATTEQRDKITIIEK